MHEKFTVQDIQTVRAQFPDVVILAHPECSPEVVAASDFSGSTNAMIRYVQQTKAPHYLLLTECAMGDNIAAANPDKEMLRLCMVRCPHMNTITMEETRDAAQAHAVRDRGAGGDPPEGLPGRGPHDPDRLRHEDR